MTRLTDVQFALGMSLIWLLFYNGRFWAETFAAMWQPSLRSAAFIASLFALALTVHLLLLLLLPVRLMRAVASLFFVMAAAGAYFSDVFGAIFNQDMMRNVLETDVAEVRGLISAHLVLHLVMFGLFPAMLLWRIPVVSGPCSWSSVRRRIIFLVCALTIAVAGAFASSAQYAVYLRVHKPIRFSLVPAAPAVSLVELLSKHSNHLEDPQLKRSLLNPAGHSVRVGPIGKRPAVMVLVLGETARAQNFALQGYGRPTNPRLATLPGLVYFENVTSCGTSTAISVPCMFSSLSRAGFKVERADRYANLLDALVDAGIAVEWFDNNAGCKGVCARVPTTTYAGRHDAEHCPNMYCYDSVMLRDVAERLRRVDHDTLLVLHQIGSHGPAYSERYPSTSETFRPACQSHRLESCTREEIVNAYDNTIVATDALLADLIALLQENQAVDGALLYVSDHGESLGERGLYLHGMPHAFAPESQTHVPMLFWASQGWSMVSRVRIDCLLAHRREPLSHDNLYHMVLGAMRVGNAAYDPRRDILGTCQSRSYPNS